MSITNKLEVRVTELLQAISKKQKQLEEDKEAKVHTKFEENNLFINLSLLKQLSPMSPVLLEFKREHPSYKL